ncbi:WXG100 family type VII secretion target [Streptomyces sp. NPDC059740]|uniref:WXG100 family type VII secretion target n=1 Tax=Streptomyces sp. NPDC059740 TaxID=3346926 RepID=UPI00365CB8EF
MAGGTFNVEPDVLRNQGDVFIGLGSDFTSASKRLQQTLEGLKDTEADGATWGEADFADLFIQIYEPIRTGLFESMDSLGERIGDIGDKLQDMAKQYADADDQSVILMTDVPQPTV